MDEVLLCGDCKKWKPWPCKRINTHRYGTCTVKNATTTRVTFCRLGDHGKKANKKKAPRPLTKRQKDIYALYLQGKTKREIADELGITPGTVRSALLAISLKITADADEGDDE